MPQTKKTKIKLFKKIKITDFLTARSPSKRNLCIGKTGCDGVFHCTRDNDVGIF